MSIMKLTKLCNSKFIAISLYMIFNFIIITPFLKLGFNNIYIEIVEILIGLILILYVILNISINRMKKKDFYMLFILIGFLLFETLISSYGIKAGVNELRQILIPIIFYYSIKFNDGYTRKYMLPKLAIGIAVIMVSLQFIKPSIVRGYYTNFSNGLSGKTNFIAGSRYNRIIGLFDDPNVFAALMVIILSVGLILVGKKIKGQHIILIGLNYLIILLTQSRWGIGVGTIVLLIYFFFISRSEKVKITVITAAVIVLIFICFPQIFEIVRLRFSKTTSDGLANDPRFIKWKINFFEIFSKVRYVLIGKGLGATGIESGKIIMENSYFDLIYKCGIIGFIIYYYSIFRMMFIKNIFYLLPLATLLIINLMSDIYRIPSIMIVVFTFYAVIKKEDYNEDVLN